MWRVCQVAPPAGPAALLSYSSLLYNTQVIDKRLYRHVELIQSFLMWTDQVTNNCFCFYLPAHSLHCCSLISSVFLRWEATTALWQWLHCVIKLCVVPHPFISLFIWPCHSQPSATLAASWYKPLSSPRPPISFCSFPLSLFSFIFYSMSHDSIHICLLLA